MSYETRESLYWLRLMAKSEIVALERIDALIQETEATIAIITTIIRRTKQNN